MPLAAPVNNSSNTLAGALSGSASRIRAAPPDTGGQAMEVPLKVAEAVSLLWPAEVTPLPGAHMSVEPTVMAAGTKAGEKRHASLLELPPATTTTTPEFTAAFTASLMAC